MRLIAELEDEAGSEAARVVVATDEEARTFTRWVDGLPSRGHDALLQLRAYGFVGCLDRLEAQLLRALETAGVPLRARSVGLRVLAILARRGRESCLLLGDELACC